MHYVVEIQDEYGSMVEYACEQPPLFHVGEFGNAGYPTFFDDKGGDTIRPIGCRFPVEAALTGRANSSFCPA